MLCVLQVDQVVIGAPIPNVLHVSKRAEPARPAAQIGEPDAPALEIPAEGNEVSGFRANAGILGRDDGVRAAMTALRLILIEGLAHRLPRSGPVIAVIRSEEHTSELQSLRHLV